MQVEKKSIEDNFRESLLEMVALLRKLEPFGGTVSELADIAELATVNPVQLKILLVQVTKK